MEGVPLDLSSPRKVRRTEDPDELCRPLDLSGPLDLSTPKHQWEGEYSPNDPPIEPPSDHGHPNIQDSNYNKCTQLFTRIASSLGTPEAALHPDLKRSLLSIWDWQFMPIADPDPASRIVVLSIGGRQVFWFRTLQPCGPLKLLTEVPGLVLPGYTVLYVELVTELQGEGSQQTLHRTLHVIDGLMLDGVDISRLALHQRYARCKQFVATLVGSLESARRIRMKPRFELCKLESFFADTKEFHLRDGQRRPGYIVSNGDAPVRFFIPHGLLLLRDTKPSVHRHVSKRCHQFYYYHATSKFSSFAEQPAMATFEETFRMRTVWTWDFVGEGNDSIASSSKAKVVRHELLAYIQSRQQAK